MEATINDIEVQIDIYLPVLSEIRIPTQNDKY